MSFTLSRVVPWGRSFAEYRGMFALSDPDLAGRILGCGDGPASFNAEATSEGCRVVSMDPIYQFSAEQIESQVKQVAPRLIEQTRSNAHEFTWSVFQSVDDLAAARMAAMSKFIADYSRADAGERYVAAALPVLPFPDKTFDLALCSHLLFLYSEQFDAAFHVRSILELARVAIEVRIFPLMELGTRVSRHLEAVCAEVRTHGFAVAKVRVPYEFQKGGNEMLRVSPTHHD
jgi:hypothetical protein